MTAEEKSASLESNLDDVQGSIDQLDFATSDLVSTRIEIDELLGTVQVAIEEAMDEEAGAPDLSKLDRDAVSKAVEEMAERVSRLTESATDVAIYAEDVERQFEILKSQL